MPAVGQIFKFHDLNYHFKHTIPTKLFLFILIECYQTLQSVYAVKDFYFHIKSAT